MQSHDFTAPVVSNGGTCGTGKSNLTQSPSNSGSDMPSLRMDSPGRRGEIPEAVNMNFPEPVENLQRVLVELRVSKGQNVFQSISNSISYLYVDTNYEPIAVTAPRELAASLLLTNEDTYIIRGEIDERRIQELEAQPGVVKVYKDTPIAPFNPALLEKAEQDLVKLKDTAVDTYDCSPTVAKGTIADVAQYLGVDQIWAAGFKGQGIVVGVVDGGITAEGRPVEPFEGIRRIPNVIGGSAKDWGTKAKSWGEHGNMCATDVLGMAPEAKLYDCRIADGDAVSNALRVFDWALQQYRIDGTPHVLTNSWGIYQKSWDEFYATNPDHPFTRKVVEVINVGILVLFAAGNCGASCPNDRCGADNGSGKSIWGANGHPLVMTIGAVNKNEQFVGYSSTGPAALDPNKPDFCSITHFRGYFGCDNGTSAATPIAAGVVALLKQAKPSATQDELKNILKQTAKNIGEPGFDQNSGAGIIQAKAAFDLLAPQLPKWGEWENLGGNAFSAPSAIASGVNSLKTFVLGGDNSIYQKSWDADKWGDWQSLGGFSLSAPASIAVGENLHVFTISQQRQIQQIIANGDSWGTWQNLGGLCKHGVAVTASTANQIDVFTIGSDNAVYQMSWDGTNSSSWSSLGGMSLSAPAAVSSQQNRIDIFIRGVDHGIYHKYWNGNVWSDKWESLGGVWLYAPTVASWGKDRLDLFAVSTDNAVYRKYFDGVTWSSWENIGGSCIASPAAVSGNGNQIDLFVVGGDNAIYRRRFV